MQIGFLELNEVLEIHDDQIRRYGGSFGVRDMTLLQSTLAMPGAGFGDRYFHKDVFEMSAAYLFHLAQNHPFVDGNKRTAAAAANVFLLLHGVVLTAKEKQFESLVRAVASGNLTKQDVADFFRKYSHKKKSS